MSDSTPALPDLSLCSREPIHIPGAVQPHGALIALEEPALRIEQASGNVEALLGVSAENLLGAPLSRVAGPAALDRLSRLLGSPDIRSELPLKLDLGADGAVRTFDGIVHRGKDALILELEPAETREGAEEAALFFSRLRSALSEFQPLQELPALHAAVARQVKRLTGFDRVMIYRFDAEWNGEVVAEALESGMDPYFGLHYPSTDIPEQARRLYTENWLRIIANVSYQPSPLIPALNPRTGRPLDLSGSVLRSVSPVHLEYLRNMGVGASMSMSLIVNGKLWGLIACHHRAARALPYALRAACELLAQTVSLQIGVLEERKEVAARLRAKQVQTGFFDLISHEENVADALTGYTPELLAMVGASGAAVCLGDRCERIGTTPETDAICGLREWLHGQPNRSLFSTDRLSAAYPPAAAFKESASGFLAVGLSEAVDNYVMFFRPEVVSTVTWAGDPSKPAIEVGAGGEVRIHPRKSFAAWKETVTGRSLPWSAVDLETAGELRNAINALILRRTDRLLRLNSELERKNTDLNSFAYIASHDLKAPLRNMRNLAGMVLDTLPKTIDSEARRRLNMIHAEVCRAEELISALRDYSRLGRIEVVPREAEMGAIVAEALDHLRPSIESAKAVVTRPASMPSVRCDPVLVRQIWVNLISNAIKYNTKPEKRVEIGVEASPNGETVFHVSDNGIGIRPKQQEAVFQMFRRMHEPDEFGGGLGVGLAIVKTLAERHGGRVWVTSEPGVGSTFYFTLAAPVQASEALTR